MTSSCQFVIACTLLVAIATAQSVCDGKPTQSTCLGATRTAQSNDNCVWREQRCMVDPCTQIGRNETCKHDRGCVPVFWATYDPSPSCVSVHLLCTKLSGGPVCDSAGYCLTQGADCVWALPENPGEASDNQPAECLSFPAWSVALVVIWLMLMGILVFIIMIMKKKKNTDAISGVEQSEVNVDSVHINDSFQPANANSTAPLMANQL